MFWGIAILTIEITGGISMMIWLTRHERRLTRAKKYCQRRLAELRFEQLVRGADREEECVALKEAVHILWLLSWYVYD